MSLGRGLTSFKFINNNLKSFCPTGHRNNEKEYGSIMFKKYTNCLNKGIFRIKRSQIELV